MNLTKVSNISKYFVNKFFGYYNILKQNREYQKIEQFENSSLGTLLLSSFVNFFSFLFLPSSLL